MSDRIYKVLTASIPSPLPPQTAQIAENATETAYLVGELGFTDWDGIGTLVGEWDQVTSEPLSAITSDYVDWIRPLGNEDGKATGLLDSTRWQGHAEAKFLEAGSRYTTTDSPVTLEITRQDNSPDNPPWGRVVKQLKADPERNIALRSIGVYTDPECTILDYSTPVFINDGKYGDVWYVECPLAERTPTPDQINFALLLVTVQEGYFNLPDDDQEGLFWRDPMVRNRSGGSISYMLVTQYGARYGAKTSDSSLVLTNLSPEGYAVAEITVRPNDRVELKLDGGNQDAADPTVIFRRIADGTTYAVGMIWVPAMMGYRSGPEVGIHAAAMSLEGYIRLLDIQWN